MTPVVAKKKYTDRLAHDSRITHADVFCQFREMKLFSRIYLNHTRKLFFELFLEARITLLDSTHSIESLPSSDLFCDS